MLKLRKAWDKLDKFFSSGKLFKRRLIFKQDPFMALIMDENEPPSLESEGFTEKFKFLHKYLLNGARILNKSISPVRNSTHSILNNLKRLISFSTYGKYLPHFAIALLVATVGISNIKDKILARAAYDQLVPPAPEVQVSVSSSVDRYTPIINSDSSAVDRYLSASPTAEGFLTNSASVETVVTDREEPLPDNSDNTVHYAVRNGDTLTSLGWKFDVKLSTLKYLNEIENENLLKPGAKLKIPPKGYEVSSTVIAKKEADKKAKLAAATRTTYTRSNASTRSDGDSVDYKPGNKSNGYPYGYCTYYVASRRYVPTSWGNAKNWLNSAQRAGYATGQEPKVGSIVVTSESWWGHVAFVESVNGNSITISEMNARGWGVTSRRTISAYGGVVRGYVY